MRFVPICISNIDLLIDFFNISWEILLEHRILSTLQFLFNRKVKGLKRWLSD